MRNHLSTICPKITLICKSCVDLKLRNIELEKENASLYGQIMECIE